MIRPPDGSLATLPPLPETLSSAKALPATTVAPPPAEPTRAQIETAVAQANRQMTTVAPALEFEIDPDTQAVVIRLVDRQNQRVLRQVPSDEMLAISRALERMQALLLRARA